MIRHILGSLLLAVLLTILPRPALAQSGAPAVARDNSEVLQVRFAPPLDRPLRYRLTKTEQEDGKPVVMTLEQEVTFTRDGAGYVMSLRWLSLSVGGETLDLTKDDLPLPPSIAIMIRPVSLELSPTGQILRIRDWDRFRKEMGEAGPALAKLMAQNPQERQEFADFFSVFFAQISKVPAERAPWLMVYAWPEVFLMIDASGKPGTPVSTRHPVQSVYAPEPLTYTFQTRLSRSADGKGLRVVSAGSPDAAGSKAIAAAMAKVIMAAVPADDPIDPEMLDVVLGNPRFSTQLDIDFDAATGLPRKAKINLIEAFDGFDASSSTVLEAI